MANGEPLAAREPLLTLPILDVVYKKIIIENFYVLFYVLYKKLNRYSFIYGVLSKTLF